MIKAIVEKKEKDRNYSDSDKECVRNPILIIRNDNLLWANKEFWLLNDKYSSNEISPTLIDNIIGIFKDGEWNNSEDGSKVCRISIGKDEPPYYITHLPSDSFGFGETAIYQISQSPNRKNADNSIRNYNITAVINELGRKLDHSYRLEDTFKIILIGATAGEGLGFNRAFLLLYDAENKAFRGEVAIGPSDGEEAAAIWMELDGSPKSLDELINNYKNATLKRDVKVNELVREIFIPIDNLCEQLSKVIRNKKPRIIKEGSCNDSTENGWSLFKILGIDCFAAAPLMVEGNIVGLLLADNMITRRPVDDSDLEVLGIFANHAGTAIQRSRLYEELAEKINELSSANEKIRESQKKLIESEKLTAIGKMASQVAHEIRNPLSVIGGYAKNIKRKMDDDDKFSEFMEIIIKEVERIEKVLETFDSLSKTAPEEKTIINFSELVKGVINIAENNSSSGMRIFEINKMEGNAKIFGGEAQLRNAILSVAKQFIKDDKESFPISVSTKIEGEAVLLNFIPQISDTGKKHPNTIFEALYGNSPLKRDTVLTIANEIINRHLGMIGIEQGKDKPLSVYIKLPLYKE